MGEMDLISEDVVMDAPPPIRGGANGFHVDVGAVAHTGRLAALCFGIVVAVLVALRPPMVVQHDDEGEQSLSGVRIALIGVCSAATTVLLLHR